MAAKNTSFRSDAGRASTGGLVLVTGLVMSVFFLLGALMLITNAVSINWPWSNGLNVPDLPDIAENEVQVTQPEVAEVIEIEAISLDCRARVHARVPVMGTKEHKALGQVYRTDSVEMTAFGDVDTCVSSNEVIIREGTDDESTIVVIPASAISFERPRVDAPATQRSVTFDKGFVGKLTDAAPWVDDSEGLTAAGYTFAQGIIGSSECMREAYDITREMIIAAYSEQMVDKGGDADQVQVIIDGEPNYYRHSEEIDTLNEFDFEVRQSDITCRVEPVNDPFLGSSSDPS
jgi:hypothetical protein